MFTSLSTESNPQGTSPVRNRQWFFPQHRRSPLRSGRTLIKQQVSVGCLLHIQPSQTLREQAPSEPAMIFCARSSWSTEERTGWIKQSVFIWDYVRSSPLSKSGRTELEATSPVGQVVWRLRQVSTISPHDLTAEEGGLVSEGVTDHKIESRGEPFRGRVCFVASVWLLGTLSVPRSTCSSWFPKVKLSTYPHSLCRQRPTSAVRLECL